MISFPNPSTIFLQSLLRLPPPPPLSPSLHLSGLSAFIHLKLQLMMNETNLPWAQTWVALWDSAQLPTGRPGPNSLFMGCINTSPTISLETHPSHGTTSFFSPPHSNSSIFVLKSAFLLPSALLYFCQIYPHTLFPPKAYFKTVISSFLLS